MPTNLGDGNTWDLKELVLDEASAMAPPQRTVPPLHTNTDDCHMDPASTGRVALSNGACEGLDMQPQRRPGQSCTSHRRSDQHPFVDVFGSYLSGRLWLSSDPCIRSRVVLPAVKLAPSVVSRKSTEQCGTFGALSFVDDPCLSRTRLVRGLTFGFFATRSRFGFLFRRFVLRLQVDCSSLPQHTGQVTVPCPLHVLHFATPTLFGTPAPPGRVCTSPTPSHRLQMSSPHPFLQHGHALGRATTRLSKYAGRLGPRLSPSFPCARVCHRGAHPRPLISNAVSVRLPGMPRHSSTAPSPHPMEPGLFWVRTHTSPFSTTLVTDNPKHAIPSPPLPPTVRVCVSVSERGREG